MANNPNQMKNLKHFQPGNPGGGRPKGSKSLTRILKEALEKELTLSDKKTGTKETKQVSEWLVAAMVRDAVKGDLKAIREVYDRIEGRPVQKIDQKTSLDFKSIDLSSLSIEQIEKLIEDNTPRHDEDFDAD